MTSAADLLALAERVEALTGPDDAVDLAIAEWCYANGGVAGVNYDPQLWVIRHGGEFTASLDAAMSLVPDGYDWILGRTNGGLTVHAEVGNREQIFAATPALALTAAALRARAAQEQAA
jgi:hypothetical protein